MPQAITLDPSRVPAGAQSLHQKMSELVIGQDEALREIVRVYQKHQAGLAAPGRPVGTFLFLGPTGTGKTRTVEAAAEVLIGTPRSAIRIDCGEYANNHEVCKLLGAPPGYLGHGDTQSLLTQKVINRHHTDTLELTFLLFDEIEKSCDSLWHLLLGIMDNATLTLGNNTKVDFSKCLIFMTSNLGVAEMNNLVNPKLGFSHDQIIRGEKVDQKRTKVGVEAARRKFAPEFMNRIDKTVVFNPLTEHELRSVLDIELRIVQNRLLHEGGLDKAFVLTISRSAREFILAQGVDIRWGARYLKRAIDRQLVDPIRNLIGTNQACGGDWISADMDGDHIQFKRSGRLLGMKKMADIAREENYVG